MLGGELWRLRFQPSKRLVADLTKSVTRADAGPGDIARAEVKGLVFDIHHCLTAQAEIELLDRMIVARPECADGHFTAHHEKARGAQIALHEAINRQALLQCWSLRGIRVFRFEESRAFDGVMRRVD